MKNGFTLAEVLITLGVIGVVSAITLPTLIQKQNEKATIVKLKKTYSTLSQAYMRAIQENDSPDYWNVGDRGTIEASSNFIEKLKPYFKIIETCDYNGNCFAPIHYDLSGHKRTLYDNRTFGTLADGTTFWVYVYSNDCSYSASETDTKLQNICAEFKIDINGKKAPNTYAKDIFAFYFTKNNIIPYGTVNEKNSFSTLCNIESEIVNNGDSCAAWVLYNENMDYLHCNDLSWDGKTKCK